MRKEVATVRTLALLGVVFLPIAAGAAAAATFGDGFATEDLAAYLENAGGAKPENIALERAEGMTGKRVLRLANKAEARFKMVPVDENTKYTLTFRGRFDGGESIEDNPRFDTFVTAGSKPPILPFREVEFFDDDRKPVRGNDAVASAMPFRTWQPYRDTFYSPTGAAFLRLTISTPQAGLTFYMDDVKFVKTPDEGAINCNPIQGKYGLYDYSGWRRPAAGGKLVEIENGKIAFDTKYGTGGTTFPLSQSGTYSLTATARGNGYNSVVILHLFDGNGKKIEEVALREYTAPRYFVMPPGVKRGAFLVYSNILEEVRLVRIGDENKINEVRKK
jgi:hypothetical protein